MVTVLLSILKIIGIILLCVLLLALTILLLVLFVPVRYRIKGSRQEGDDVPVRADVKATWLMHILNVSFRYPEEAYIRVRLFCFTVFSTLKKEKEGKEKEKEEEKNKKIREEETSDKKEQTSQSGTIEHREADDMQETEEENGKEAEKKEIKEENPTLSKFFKKLFSILKNIKYTIIQIYGKIRHIIGNIRYYIDIIESDSFKRAFSVCGSEAAGLIKSILPRKITGNFVIGTGDPASTARILSVQGILYPIIGNHINITPDFDNAVAEGDFFIKGKITVFKILKTAIKVYFNKDLRRVIRLFKKEAV